MLMNIKRKVCLCIDTFRLAVSYEWHTSDGAAVLIGSSEIYRYAFLKHVDGYGYTMGADCSLFLT
jgi:hypothetical protein